MRAMTVALALLVAAGLQGCRGAGEARVPDAAVSEQVAEDQAAIQLADQDGGGSDDVAGQDQTTPESVADATNDRGQAAPEGWLTLSGTVYTHEQVIASGDTVSVVSVLLDAPFDYEFEYRGETETWTATDVGLASDAGIFLPSEEYAEWASYDGRHVTLACEGLAGVYHDGSYFGIDAVISGGSQVLSVE